MIKNLFSVLLVVALAGLSCPVHAQISERKPHISSDEMLEFTLNDLKLQLQKVVAENTRLSNRNNALRKRMLSFQQDMRELENHKLNLLERNSDLRDFLKLDTREHALMKKKMVELEEESSFTDEVRGTLAQTVEQNRERHQKLENAIAKVTSDIEDLHQSRLKNRSRKTYDIEERKNELLARIQQTGASNRVLQRKFPALKEQLVKLEAKRQTVLSRNSELKAQVESSEAEIAQAHSQEELLSRRSRERLENSDQETAELKQKLSELNAAYEGLSSAKQGLLAAQQKVDADVAGQRLEVKNIVDLLTKENQQLKKQKDILLARLNLEETTGPQGYKEMEDKIRELTDQIGPLKTENAELGNKIAEQNRQGQGLKKQEMALKAELIQLGDDIRKVQNKGKQSVEEALKERKNNLTKLISTYQTKNEGTQKQVSAHQEKTRQSRERIESWGDRQKEFEIALRTARDELQTARDAEGAIRQEAKDMEGRQSQGAETLKDEIATLELRKSVLTTSLAAIKDKYTQDKITIKEFVHSDQKELEQYLGVLKTENDSLKERLVGLGAMVSGLNTP